MQITRKNCAILIMPSLLVLTAIGCSPQHRGNNDPAGRQPNASAIKRFQDPALQGRTAVESAIELSQKYAELSDQVAALREKNQALTAENAQFTGQISALESKLKQTQKELTEANDLLIEMLTELNNWKANILGFRNEMRDATKAQLEALLKVLEILGGQTTTPSPATPNTPPAQPRTPQTQSQGEPNE